MVPQADDRDDKLNQIKESLLQTLLSLCQCQPQLSQAEFSCRTGPPNTVIYRARITGTSSQSASEVAAIIGAWVKADKGSVKINHLRLHLDPACDPTLENIHGPDCRVDEPTAEATTNTDEPLMVETRVVTGASATVPTNTPTLKPTNPPPTTKEPETTKKPDSETNKESVKGAGNRGSSGGNDGNGAGPGLVVGILLGCVIACLLTALVVIIILILYHRYKTV